MNTAIASRFDIDKIYILGSYVKDEVANTSDIDSDMKLSLYGLDYFEFIEILREALGKENDSVSNRTIEIDSKVYQEIKKSVVLIYER